MSGVAQPAKDAIGASVHKLVSMPTSAENRALETDLTFAASVFEIPFAYYSVTPALGCNQRNDVKPLDFSSAPMCAFVSALFS